LYKNDERIREEEMELRREGGMTFDKWRHLIHHHSTAVFYEN
jgi:hypothetical protein